MSVERPSKTGFTVTGEVFETHRDIRTGEIIHEYHESNIFLDQGKSVILQLLSESGEVSSGVDRIVIGNDVGTGTVMEPEPTHVGLTESDQKDVYTATDTNFVISYPTSDSVRYYAAINGESVMAQYPSEPNVVYTSATIRTGDNKAIAYRRFSPRTISSLISVDLIWILKIN